MNSNHTYFVKGKTFLFFFAFIFNCAAAQNIVGTYSGKGSTGFQNGDTAAATFNGPFGMCRDKSGNLYIADSKNNVIRKISANGTVSTYAGTGTAGYKDTVASLAMFNEPSDICVDDAGTIFVSDFLNHRIRKIAANGVVSTVAGAGVTVWL